MNTNTTYFTCHLLLSFSAFKCLIKPFLDDNINFAATMSSILKVFYSVISGNEDITMYINIYIYYIILYIDWVYLFCGMV